MAGFVIRVMAICLVSSALGGGMAALRGLPWTPDAAEVKTRIDIKNDVGKEHDKLRATIGISFEELRSMIDQGAVVIDARHAPEFAKGHLNTGGEPPVLNIDAGSLERSIERLERLRGIPWVLYCTSNTCEMAEELYVAMEKFGLIDEGMVKIYFPGWEDLEKRHLPTATGPDEWHPENAQVPPEQSVYRLQLKDSDVTYRPTTEGGSPDSKPSNP